MLSEATYVEAETLIVELMKEPATKVTPLFPSPFLGLLFSFGCIVFPKHTH